MNVTPDHSMYALNELVPSIVRDTGVVIAARPEVDDLLYTSPFGGIHEILALTEHIYGVAGRHEDAVYSFKSRTERLNLVEIEVNDRHTELLSLAWRARRGDNFYMSLPRQQRYQSTTYLAGCAHHEHSCFRPHKRLLLFCCLRTRHRHLRKKTESLTSGLSCYFVMDSAARAIMSTTSCGRDIKGA